MNLYMDSDISGFFSKKSGSYNIPPGVFCINIDHHATNTYFGSLNYIDKKSPSACSVILDFFRSINLRFDKELATLLCIGVYTDSVGFQADNNPQKALKDAVFLIEQGADYSSVILNKIVYSMPLKIKKFFGILFNNLKFDKERKCGYSLVKYGEIADLGLNESEIRLGINEMQYIEEFDIVFNLIELKESIKGSFRSKKGRDVSKIAEIFGGGGHRSAAGFILPKIPLEKAKAQVFEAMDSFSDKKD